jgi:very-short-patch-repair endonuclease
MKFEAFGKCIDRCESFIERRLAVAFLFSEAFTFEPIDDTPFVVARDVMGVRLLQQVKIEQHRVDFALVHPSGSLRLAIECDGHDFHDGDKDGAARDRARDRHLLGLGWTTARFTGRELVADAMRCAVDAHRLVVRSVPDLDAPRAETGGTRCAIPAPPRNGEWDRRFALCNGDFEAELAVAREAHAAALMRHGMGGGR